MAITTTPANNEASLSADDLILFAHVANAGSFTRAADHTGLPKSTLSRRVTELENLLGERLLTRTTRKLTITDFGEHILEHARRLLDETEAARSLALHRQLTPQGVLRVSLPTEYRDMAIDTIIQRFHAEYPQVRLELDLSARRVDLIAERFDLAIRVAGELPDDNTLIARPALVLCNGLYASPAYLKRRGTPETPEGLEAHDGLTLISSSGEHQPWLLNRGKEEWKGMPQIVFSSNSVGLHQSLALAGMGIVGMSEQFARPQIKAGVLVRVLPEWTLPPMTVWCVVPGRRLMPQRTRAFMDIAMETMGAL